MSLREKQFSIRIVGIDQHGTSVKILSPMSGDMPIPIKNGTRLIIHEQLKGDEPRSHVVVAGPDHRYLNQPYQYFDDEIGKWVLIVQQSAERPIGARSAVRVNISFDVSLTVVEDNKKYKVKSKDISATGMLLTADLGLAITKNSEIVLEFKLPDSFYEFPPITGKVIHIEKNKEKSDSLSCDIGVKFDDFPNQEDQNEITRFVLKKQDI